MGLFGGLFGKKEQEATDRCMDCGMAGGEHTDWCPSIGTEETPTEVTARESAEPARGGSNDQPAQGSAG